MEVLTTRIPEDLLKDIQQIEKDERSERAEVVRKLLDTAVQEWKMTKGTQDDIRRTMDCQARGQVCRNELPRDSGEDDRPRRRLGPSAEGLEGRP